MRRDLDLIRKILLVIENSPTGYAPDRLEIEGYSEQQIQYHAYLLIQAELAEGSVTTSSDGSGPEAIINNLTWWGHEFAEAARDESRWKKAMNVVREKGGAVTLDVVKDLLVSYMKDAFSLT